jgi:excisionase family DNA binding protein
MTERLLLRANEAADLMGVSRSLVYELLRSGTLPSVRIGASVRVPADALRAWIDARTSESEPCR